MTTTPFRNLVAQNLQPLVLPYGKKGPPEKGWHLKEPMSLEEADVNDALLLEGKIGLAVALAPHLVAVDVDIQDPDVVDELFGKIQHTPCRKLGAKGFTCIYRSDGSAHKSFPLTEIARQALGEPKAKIEFLAGNHYTILPPSIHPDTEAPYQWLLEDQEIILANLPLFNRAEFEALMLDIDVSTEGWGTITQPKKKGAQPGNNNAASDKNAPAIVHNYIVGAFQDDPVAEKLAEFCLRYIPADCAYEDWAKVGLALNHTITGEKGAGIFYRWSKTATNAYPDSDVVRKCNDIFHGGAPTTGRQLTFSHLEYRAKQNPLFHLEVTPEQLTALAIINTSIAANRYDIGDLETVTAQSDTLKIPEEYSQMPIHAEKIHVAFAIQLLGNNIVATENKVMTFSQKLRKWQEAKKHGSSALAEAEVASIRYIQSHPRFEDSFIKANGEISEAKRQAALMQLGSNARQSSICALILRNPSALPQKREDEFDALNEMLAMPDGRKVCLRTGEVSDIEPTDYLRKVSGCTIAPKGEYGNAPSILMDAFSENKDPRAMSVFFQRLGGYCLSGDVSLQKIFCFLGSSNNGKTFFVNQLRMLMGEFANVISSKLIMADKKGYDLDPDRARASVVGLRLAAVTDTKATAVFNEEVFKGITDLKLSFRKLYEETNEATNHAKLIVCCNDIPSLGSWDAAMQRRFVCVPFCKTFASDKSKDNALAEELRNGMPGLLRWFVDGRIAMLEDNNDLKIAPEVIEGTEEQIFLGDPLTLAVSLACSNPASQTFVTNEEIATCLAQWMHSADDRFPSGLDFEALHNPQVISKKLAALGFKRDIRRVQTEKSNDMKRGWFMDLTYPEFKGQQTAVRDIMDSLVN